MSVQTRVKTSTAKVKNWTRSMKPCKRLRLELYSLLTCFGAKVRNVKESLRLSDMSGKSSQSVGPVDVSHLKK